MYEELKLATSRYHATGPIKDSGLLPVGITVGSARFLRYELAANVGMLAPFGMLKVEPFAKFEKLYRTRLDEFGVDAIGRVLTALAIAHQAEGAVLLCFEKVHEGETCHRRTFANWWEQKTGNVVPELELNPELVK